MFEAQGILPHEVDQMTIPEITCICSRKEKPFEPVEEMKEKYLKYKNATWQDVIRWRERGE